MEQITPLLITGLLAILGTVIGNIINGYWSTQLAKKNAQSALIQKAMESPDPKVRAKSLEFLIKVNLIDDKKIQYGVNEILKSKELDLLPQFNASNIVQTDKTGVTEMKSAKSQLVGKEKAEGNPIEQDNFLALTGFVVRSGDIIDGFTPIFSEIGTEDKLFKSKRTGKHFGGDGGSPTEIYKEGYLITGIELIRGYYFGREEVIHMQVTWNKLTPNGIDYNDKVISEKIGSGNFAEFNENTPSKVFQAKQNHFITDFSAQQSYHSDGSTFIHDMTIKEEILPA
ncbi:hypothetical protein [Bernardetia sp.]|uniref:hypothetical protein n=1 Tax=Bernardetia sp. TaxID=1937974 RepID=UPI0025C4EBB3|nr:hypothetical protein [Bernardetia sp.]